MAYFFQPNSYFQFEVISNKMAATRNIKLYNLSWPLTFWKGIFPIGVRQTLRTKRYPKA